MFKNDVQDEILVKTKDGDFQVLRGGRLVDLPSDELSVPQDEIVVRDREMPTMAALQAGGAAKSSFYFDVDDEHEIRKLMEKGDEDKNKAIKNFIDRVVADIIGSAGLGQAALENLQLKNIITSRLKNVRSLAESKEALLESPGVRILGLDRGRVDELLRLVEARRDEVEKAIKTGKVAEIKPKPVVKPVQFQAAPVKKEPAKSRELEGVKYEKEYEVVGGDELSRHVTTGPVEEIKMLGLKDFRRLGSNPREAAERVLKKIDLLGDESLVKKAEGVKAWQESEVYRTYLAIGAASMAEKKPVEAVIREFKDSNKPYLAPEEFNEVADLNRRLSY